ncbi:hypothetical protein GCM10017691_45520 [Pseudonocardia petroleophila]|uniref:Helix-hairpin-helix domain-containing protein n=1 Tax=Pseudonocardia petroleophila TaxID=37331 RepID=A0A7G7MR15_9PSEU|nr:ComEA family DNA-binding protein [Pseudonocardia petroleophila]QNG55226.1 helix-hairpin-helix domain-containing protein [Pseudonocardia petroleophila]
MARREPSGGRLASALGPPVRPERMPPDGTWPPVLREPTSRGLDPPTVPLPLAGRYPPSGALGAGRPPGGRAGAVDLPAPDDVPSTGQRDDPWTGPDGAGAAPSGRSGVRSRILSALVPAAWRGARVDPGRPGAKALALVAALAAVVAAVGVWTDRPRTEPVAALPAVVVTDAPDSPGTASAPAGAAPAEPAGPLVLSVSGKVARPGLIELPDGSRVADALEAAGGALPGTDLSSLNLARRVVDGEQIAVGVPPAADAAPVSGGTAGPAAGEGAATGGPVDLNTATESQLDSLPGVGPVTAQRILEWRERNGRFTRVEQLREIEGIGERRFAQLRELVVV